MKYQLKKKSSFSLALIFLALSGCAHTSVQSFDLNHRTPASLKHSLSCPQLLHLSDGKAFEGKLDEFYGYQDPLRQAKESDLMTESLQSAWNKIEGKIHWSLWQEPEHEALRFIRLYYVSGQVHAEPIIELYGIEGFKGFRNADDYLKRLPKENFKLTDQIAIEAHRLVTEPLVKNWHKVAGVFSRGLPTRTGGFKKIHNQGFQLWNGISETSYETLKSNPWIDRFIEVPWSKPGNRKGIVRYSKPEDVELKIKKLFDWVNTNPEKLDPIELAARFQYRFVSIHPFNDQNGRVSRLLMDRILYQHELPAPVLKTGDLDIYYPENEWVDRVREGVYRAIQYAKNAYSSRPQSKVLGSIPAVKDINMKDTPMTLAEDYVQGRLPSSLRDEIKSLVEFSAQNREFVVQGERLMLMADGMLYNNRGIPHLFHDDVLYPIADETYLLYAEGFSGGGASTSASLNIHHEKVISRNLEVLSRFEGQSQIPLKRIDYSVIESANKNNQIYLYPWQKDLFKTAITITETNPLKVLSSIRGGNSTFERAVEKGHRFSVSAVLAQYEWMDLKFSKYQDFAKKHFPEWVPAVEASRRKLHQAGRELLAKYENQLRLLTTEQQQAAAAHPRMKIFNNYIRFSKLNYSTYDEGIKKLGDEHVTMIRSGKKYWSKVGFPADRLNGFLIEKIFGQRGVKFIEKLHSNWATLKKQYLEKTGGTFRGDRSLERISLSEVIQSSRDSGLKLEYQWFYSVLGKQIDRVDLNVSKLVRALESEYHYKGAAKEFERGLVDDMLHMTDYLAVKNGTSWSVHTDLYVKEVDGHFAVPFVDKASDGGLEGSIYMARIPKKWVRPNIANKYLNQYEVVVDRQMVSPLRIKEALDVREFLKAPENSAPKFDKWFYLDSK